MKRLTLPMDIEIYLTSSGILLIWRMCPSGSLYMRPSRVFFPWGCVSGAKPSSHTSPSPILITGVVVVLFRPTLGISTGTDFFLYIVVW